LIEYVTLATNLWSGISNGLTGWDYTFEKRE